MSIKKPSISIIIPCLNEEGNLRGTIEAVKDALKTTGVFSEYEILIFNDGSIDKTGAIADEIKKTEKGVRVIHNPSNMGFGYNYTEGVRLASKEYIIMVPGDNEIPADAIKKVFALAGKADLIIPYTANTEVRPASRRAISWLFVVSINTLFGLRLRYYNGTCVIKTSLLKKCPLKTWGFAYMAAILVRLIKSGASYIETGVDIRPRDTGRSKAFAPKNVVSVFKAVFMLFWDVRVKDRGKYASAARRVAS